jgi:hypothetical protein
MVQRQPLTPERLLSGSLWEVVRVAMCITEAFVLGRARPSIRCRDRALENDTRFRVRTRWTVRDPETVNAETQIIAEAARQALATASFNP